MDYQLASADPSSAGKMPASPIPRTLACEITSTAYTLSSALSIGAATHWSAAFWGLPRLGLLLSSGRLEISRSYRGHENARTELMDECVERVAEVEGGTRGEVPPFASVWQLSPSSEAPSRCDRW